MKIWPGEHYRTDERPAVSGGFLLMLTWAVPFGALMWAGILYLAAWGLA